MKRSAGFVVVVLTALAVAGAAGAEETAGVPALLGSETAGGATVTAQVTVVPLDVQAALARDSVGVGRVLPVRAEIRNLSEMPVEGVTAELRTVGSIEVTGEVLQSVGVIAPLDRENAVWRICGTTPGVVIGLIRVEGLLAGGTSFTVESPAFVLELTDARGPQRCR